MKFVLVCLTVMVSVVVAVWVIGGVSGSQVAHAQVRMAQMKSGGMKSGMKMKPAMKMEMATEGIFEGVGKVITVVPELSQIVLGHEEIKGFMKAMPMGMGYEVESLDLVKGLKPGDPIKFKIDAAKKKIISIESLKEKGSGY